MLPSSQFGFRRGLSTSDALVYIVHDLQASLDAGHESRLISLDFSSAFDRVNHNALLSKIRSIGVGGCFLQILSQFLTNRKQRVSLDGCYSPFSPVVSGVPQGSVLGPLLFIIYTSDMWCGIESNIVAYADDTTIYATIPSPRDRLRVANVLSRDISNILSWCDRWGMKPNPKKSHSIVFGRSRTSIPAHPDIISKGVPIPNCSTLKLLKINLHLNINCVHWLPLSHTRLAYCESVYEYIQMMI